jgi:Rrf2 family nitric oxide-sensitive transcriptional repressor
MHPGRMNAAPVARAPQQRTMPPLFLTTPTHYALRVMIFLGLHPDQRVTRQEIARHYGISHNHLMKVVQRLGAVGYPRTVRASAR